MNKQTIYRTIRFIGMLCAMFLSIIGACGIEVPSIQEYVPASVAAVIVAVCSEVANHWFNNNYTQGAKMVQPEIKQINSAIKHETKDMGRGDEEDE